MKRGEEIKIRKANKEDIESLTKLYIEFLKYTNRFCRWIYKNKPKIETKTIGDYLSKRIFQRNSIFLVAEYKKKIAGFVQAEIVPKRKKNTDKNLVEIVDIFSKNRGKGIGKKLFNEVEIWSKEKEAEFIVWEMIHGNKIAEEFCIKNGFRHFKVEMMKKVK